MKRTPPSKKSGERRTRIRSAPARREAAPDACHSCGRKLSGQEERALFVEEEVGRIFCSESCIATYFTPEITRLEKEYFRKLTPADLSAAEREGLAHLRWITLQEPDEIWREKTLTGDLRYTLISEFKPGLKRVWSICICLFLRGEPSFLYLALVSRNAAMVNQYRRGERVAWAPESQANGHPARREGGRGAERERSLEATDRLGDPWTADETLLAQMNQERSPDDIRPDHYAKYQSCLEPTLENPDEVWSISPQGPEGPKLYHFLRHFSEEKPEHWYVIVARETEEEEQIEILDAFPTQDRHLIDSYRQGEQEVGETEKIPKATIRVVH